VRIWIGSGRKNHGQAAATFAHQFEFTALNYNTHGLISQAKLKAKIRTRAMPGGISKTRAIVLPAAAVTRQKI
jgi:hypothetical protein